MSGAGLGNIARRAGRDGSRNGVARGYFDGAFVVEWHANARGGTVGRGTAEYLISTVSIPISSRNARVTHRAR